MGWGRAGRGVPPPRSPTGPGGAGAASAWLISTSWACMQEVPNRNLLNERMLQGTMVGSVL